MIQNMQESHWIMIPATLAGIERDAPSALQWMTDVRLADEMSEQMLVANNTI